MEFPANTYDPWGDGFIFGEQKLTVFVFNFERVVWGIKAHLSQEKTRLSPTTKDVAAGRNSINYALYSD
jgi:hypothetical protein